MILWTSFLILHTLTLDQNEHPMFGSGVEDLDPWASLYNREGRGGLNSMFRYYMIQYILGLCKLQFKYHIVKYCLVQKR